jgi:hypothetical protein
MTNLEKKIVDSLQSINIHYGRGTVIRVDLPNPLKTGTCNLIRRIPTSQTGCFLENRLFKLTVLDGKIRVKLYGHTKTLIL